MSDRYICLSLTLTTHIASPKRQKAGWRQGFAIWSLLQHERRPLCVCEKANNSNKDKALYCARIAWIGFSKRQNQTNNLCCSSPWNIWGNLCYCDCIIIVKTKAFALQVLPFFECQEIRATTVWLLYSSPNERIVSIDIGTKKDKYIQSKHNTR